MWSSRDKQLRQESGYGMYFFNLSGGEQVQITVSDVQYFMVFGIENLIDINSLPTNVYYDDVLKENDSSTEWGFTNTDYRTVAVYIGALSGHSPSASIVEIVGGYLSDKLDKNQGANNAGKILVINDYGEVVPIEQGDATSIDTQLSMMSENPVQNKAISSEIGEYKTESPVTVTTLDFGLYSSSNQLKSETGYKSHFFNAEGNEVIRFSADKAPIFAIVGFLDELDVSDLVSPLTYNELIYRVNSPSAHEEYIYYNSNGYKTFALYTGKPSAAVTVTVSVNTLNNFRSFFYQGSENNGTPVFVNADGMMDGSWDTFYQLGYDTDYSWYSLVNLTYDQLIIQCYEPMRTEMPYYITRQVIGRDQSDTYDIYAYTFEPDRYEQVIYLQSGVHPYEALGYVALARLMQKIAHAKSTDTVAAYLRFNCKIVVVPVVNVWGVMQSLASRTNKNSAGIDLNTDVMTLTQAENIAVTTFFESLNTNEPVSFAFDLHTTRNNSFGDYMGTFWSDCQNRQVGLGTLYTLARKNAVKRCQEYLTQYSLEPTEINILYAGNSTADTTYAYWWKSLNISGSTVEHGDKVWTDERYTALSAEKCLENYAVQLINHAMQKFVKTYGGKTSTYWN